MWGNTSGKKSILLLAEATMGGGRWKGVIVMIRQLIVPVLEYTHEKGRCSIIGGYVYRGKALPGLVGTYVYGDFCSGEIFGHQGERNAASMSLDTLLIKSPFRISSFGVD